MMNILLSLFLALFPAGSSLAGFENLPYGAIYDFATQPIPEVRLLAFGDLMLGRDVERLMGEQGENYPLELIFGQDGLDQHQYDLVTANLEGPVYAAAKRVDLFPQFAFDPDITPRVLKNFGFNLVTLANNHTWDHSVLGWESTLSALHQAGIATVGHPKNLFDYDLYETRIHGVTIGFLGINDVNFPVDWEQAKAAARELKARNDFVVLMIHWGKEFQTGSTLHQRDKAHGMIEAGVDLIIGHHPHVVQELELYQGKYIFYSLGNFVFDQYFSEETQRGLGLDIRLRRDGDISIQEIPFQIEKGQPKLMDEDGS